MFIRTYGLGQQWFDLRENKEDGDKEMEEMELYNESSTSPVMLEGGSRRWERDRGVDARRVGRIRLNVFVLVVFKIRKKIKTNKKFKRGKIVILDRLGKNNETTMTNHTINKT